VTILSHHAGRQGDRAGRSGRQPIGTKAYRSVQSGQGLASGANATLLFRLARRRCLVVDEEGLELLDVVAVQEEAARALAGFAWDAARSSIGSDSHQLAIEVRDEAGPVMNVRFTFEIDRKH